VLRNQRNAEVIQAEVLDLDPDARTIRLRDGVLGYDTLILAAGVSHHYFGNESFARQAPGLKTIEDATHVRARILEAFERAERASAAEQAELLTFVLVGGGPTGVELAGAIGELARHSLRGEFRRIDSRQARILLVEAAPRVLPSAPESLSLAAERSLRRLGVEVLAGTRLQAIESPEVTLDRRGERLLLRAATVLWAAGVRAGPLGRILAERAGAELDREQRVRVGPDGSLPGHPEILVIGDLARLEGPDGAPLPGVAPVAIQAGRPAARVVRDRLGGRVPPPFTYRPRGNLAVIGRAAAVAELGRLRFSGYPAWLLWLFVHIMNLVGFENRLLVFVQWAFDYATRRRGARLITGEVERP
jgi:NADH dehydrogenase